MKYYRESIFELCSQMLEPAKAELNSALDFGSGEGWFASEFVSRGVMKKVTPVEVMRREKTLVEPIIYDGTRLPFPDRSFDLVYAIDCIHHTPSPAEALRDMMRCTRKYLMLKDHVFQTSLGRTALSVLDEIGNRRFKVKCVYKYQHNWEWLSTIEKEGFVKEKLIHPAACHRGPLGWTTNGLQFVALWRRNDALTHGAEV